MILLTDRGELEIDLGTTEKPATTDDDGLVFICLSRHAIEVHNRGVATRWLDGELLGWPGKHITMEPGGSARYLDPQGITRS
jgi:hypothetical protein